MSQATSPWMQYGNAEYRIGDPHAPGVTPRDIAHSLARINRFTGHTRGGVLSVARHSVFVTRLLRHQGHGVFIQRYGLVHDVHETVVQDLGWAVKQALSPSARTEYEFFAGRADRALYEVLGVPWPMSTQVKKIIKTADWIAVATEKRDLMPPGTRLWDILREPPAEWRATPTTDPDEDAALWLWELHNLNHAANEPTLPLYGDLGSPESIAV